MSTLPSLPLVYNPFGEDIVLKSIDWLEKFPWRQENCIKRGKDKYEVCLQVKDFDPSDISVKASNGYLVIECSHEERKDEYGYISRKLTRRFTLPDDCRHEDVISTLSSDGILTVVAPRQDKIKSDTVIPVTIDNSSAKCKL